MNFYHHLNYSLGNEDWQVEQQALRVKPQDHAICITASGDRPLHLLMTECAKITSIDMNQVQNHLLALKLGALNQLDYEKYLAFLGCEPSAHRLQIFREIKPHLSADVANFWSQQKNAIDRGVLFQGRIERLTYKGSKFLNLMRHKKIKTLFAFTDLQAQREYLIKSWDTTFWRKMFEIVLHPNVTRFLVNDPGLNGYVEYSRSPGNYIYQRILSYLNNNLASKSALLQLLFTGTLTPEAYFPYLTFEGYNKIRHNSGRLTYLTGNVIDYLGQNAGQFDCFSLSDIASYMPQKVFEKLLQNMYSAAKPHARFCLREFISKRAVPADLQHVLQRDAALEIKLEREESNFVYRFIAGEILKTAP